ncbi:uncharacterized protein LOC120327867 [Styela clava]
MRRSVIIVFLCHMFTTIMATQSKHMICKNVDDVFAEDEDSSILNYGSAHSRRLQGMPGKRGLKGENGVIGMPGVKGQQGAPGIVDYQKVNATVEQLIENSVEKLVTSRIEELGERLDELKKMFLGTCDGVVYLGQCYIASLHTAQDVNYDKAVAMCTKMSAKTADIIDSQHYDLVLKYIRTLMSSSIVEVTLAMTYDHSTKRVLLSNGNTASYTNYYSGYPDVTASYTQMGIAVRNPSSGDQGMYNYPRLYDRHGVLCRKELFSSN